MSPQQLSQEQARLNLPRPVVPPRRIEPARAGDPARGDRSAVLPPSRRSLLSGLTGGALGSLGPPEHFRPRDPVLALVHRITFGFRLDDYERARTLGFQAYLDEQLDPFSIEDSHTDDRLAAFPVLDLGPREVFDAYADRTQDAYVELKSARIVRAVDTKRQLHERMCEFWLDHFNVDHNKGLEWMLLPEFERTVIRPHALGSFPAMLSACAFSGAMLYYLDNWLNVRSAPQENYARELLELHTLGVDGGYNETDVAEVARCFTGWTLNPDAGSPDWMRGVFDSTQHARGQKLVLGNVIPGVPHVARPGQPGQRDDAQAVLDIVAAHPSTARFLARKLIRRFLTPTPPPALVERVASTYLETNGDIKSMLRVILTRENLSAHARAPKYRRPLHFLASLVRGLDGSAKRRQDTTLAHLVAMGHSPYDYSPPTGYPDDLASWNGALLPRWMFSVALLRDEYVTDGLAIPGPNALRAKLEVFGPADLPGLAQRMNERIFGQMLSPFEVEILQQFIDGYPSAFGIDALYDSLALASSLPGYQLY